MPREFGRNRRVADLVQRELAAVLQRERDRHRGGLLTISTVKVTPDLAQARIYITSLGPPPDHQRIISELNAAAGHYRHELAGALRLRIVPRLEFIYDESVERGARLTRLIDSLHSDVDTPDDGRD